MKKMILGLGALTAVITPVAFAADCGGQTAVANVDSSIAVESVENNGSHIVFTLTPSQGNGKKVDETTIIKAVLKLGYGNRNVTQTVKSVDLKVGNTTYSIIDSVEIGKLSATKPSILNIAEKFMEAIKTDQKLASFKDSFKFHTTTNGTDASLAPEINYNSAHQGYRNYNIVITPATGDGQKVNEAMVIKTMERFKYTHGDSAFGYAILNIDSISLQIQGQNNKIVVFDEAALDKLKNDNNNISTSFLESKIYEIAKTKDETKSYFE